MKQKLFTLLLVTLFLINKGKAQYSTSYISYEYTEIMAYSIEITYSSSSGFYQPYSPYVSLGNALATMQARYDKNHAIISKEWGKLLSLDLINLNNKATLKQHQETISAEVKMNCKGDLGNQAYADGWIEYVTQTFRIQSIKDEILLLQSCQNELTRIKYKDPDNYLYSKRYKSIMKTLDLLKNCSTSEIKNLSWEKTELENTSNNNSSNSNNEYISVTSNTNYTYKRNSEDVQIDNITKSAEYTVIQFTAFPSKEYSYGWWVNFNSNAYIEQNGKKYYLKKAEGIPLSPNKHYFSNSNESLSFKLYFDKSVNLNVKFDIIEISGSASAFNFYYISK
jgi:hypothetical protein